MSGHGLYCKQGSCLCPVHQTPLLYWSKGNLHACQNRECQYARGFDLNRMYADEVHAAWLRHKEQQRLDREAQRAYEARFWSPHVWSTPDSWQSVPEPLREPMREIASQWILPQPDPLFEGWSEHEIRRQYEGRWFTYPPEEHDDGLHDQGQRPDQQGRE